MSGQLARYDEYDEQLRQTSAAGKGFTRLGCEQAYAEQLDQNPVPESLRVQPAY